MEKRLLTAILIGLMAVPSTSVYAADTSDIQEIQQIESLDTSFGSGLDTESFSTGNLQEQLDGISLDPSATTQVNSDTDEPDISGGTDITDTATAADMELTGWDIFTANDESAIGKVVNDAFAQSFNSLLDNNESEKTSVADFFATDNGTVSIGDFQYFDLSGTALDENVDLSVLNIQYASMAENMLDSQIDLTGASTNAVDLFNNTYGDILSEIALEEPQIPSDFSASSMVALGQQAVSAAVQTASSSQLFTDVRNNIGLGNLVSTVKNGIQGTSLDPANLASFDTLSSLTAAADAANQGAMQEAYQDGRVQVARDYTDQFSMVRQTQTMALNFLDLENNVSYLVNSGDEESALDLITSRLGLTQEALGKEIANNFYVNDSDVWTETGTNFEGIKQNYKETTGEDITDDEIKDALGFMAYMASWGDIPTTIQSGVVNWDVSGTAAANSISYDGFNALQAYEFSKKEYEETGALTGENATFIWETRQDAWNNMSQEEKDKYFEAYNNSGRISVKMEVN